MLPFEHCIYQCQVSWPVQSVLTLIRGDVETFCLLLEFVFVCTAKPHKVYIKGIFLGMYGTSFVILAQVCTQYMLFFVLWLGQVRHIKARATTQTIIQEKFRVTRPFLLEAALTSFRLLQQSSLKPAHVLLLKIIGNCPFWTKTIMTFLKL